MYGKPKEEEYGPRVVFWVGSSSGLLPRKWEKLSSVGEGDGRLGRQDWA
ncbi:hypothetical protein Hanom_Chr03g00182571 [Helianthus anomalus]